MLVTVYCVRRDLSEATFSLQVSSDFELRNFRVLCELESGLPAAETQIIYMERVLADDRRSLGSYGLKDGDVVVLLQKESAGPWPAGQTLGGPRRDLAGPTEPGTSSSREPAQQGALGSGEKVHSPALIRSMLLSSPHDLALLRERNPDLAEALLSGSLDTFSQVLMEQQRERDRRQQERLHLYSADLFDLEAQAKIEEEIRQQNVQENMNIAMEEAPESFAQVPMLYVNCKVNGHALKAFVDSGAQMTIVSRACAERCNIMRLVDGRWAGVAQGVGTQRIIGRVHLAQIQIEGDFLPCSFSVLEEQPMDMLLGLDILRRHQCSIDLKNNVLVIGTTGTRTPFLPEAELPPGAKLGGAAGQHDASAREAADATRHSLPDSGRTKH